MKTKELRQKTENEMKVLLHESRDKIREMRFKVAQRQLKKVSDVKKEKKTTAQVLTLLNEKNKDEKSKELKRD